MTSTLDDARGELLALADRIEYAIRTEGGVMLYKKYGMAVVAALRAAHVPQCDAEPVAWQCRNIGKDGQPWSSWYLIDGNPNPDKAQHEDEVFKYEFRPLYAIQPSRSDAETVERCAKIAQPWAGFWLDDNSTDADRAVVEVRTEIAAKIRALALSSAEGNTP